jgi:NAD dependent epimerase/dehydratase family enzyme
MRVAITGSSGLIGSALAAGLQRDGTTVVRLVRRSPRGPDEIAWNPRDPGGGLDPAALDGLDGVVHLSGAPIAGGLWTKARKAELRSSRIQSTKVLVTAIGKAANPPAVLLSGSAIGWYGDTGTREVDESAPAGTGFLAHLVRDWEAPAWLACASRTCAPASCCPATAACSGRWCRCSGSGSVPESGPARSSSAGSR